jgi:hypothetical protein
MTPKTEPRPQVSAIGTASACGEPSCRPAVTTRQVVNPAYRRSGHPGHSVARTRELMPSAATTRSARSTPREVVTVPLAVTLETVVDSDSTPSGTRLHSASTSWDRGSKMMESPKRSDTAAGDVGRIIHRPSGRRNPGACGTAYARISSPRAKASSARSPLGARASPDPTGSTDAARSHTVTSHPAAVRLAAAASPPIPAPITTAVRRPPDSVMAPFCRCHRARR